MGGVHEMRWLDSSPIETLDTNLLDQSYLLFDSAQNGTRTQGLDFRISANRIDTFAFEDAAKKVLVYLHRFSRPDAGVT